MCCDSIEIQTAMTNEWIIILFPWESQSFSSHIFSLLFRLIGKSLKILKRLRQGSLYWIFFSLDTSRTFFLSTFQHWQQFFITRMQGKNDPSRLWAKENFIYLIFKNKFSCPQQYIENTQSHCYALQFVWRNFNEIVFKNIILLFYHIKYHFVN